MPWAFINVRIQRYGIPKSAVVDCMLYRMCVDVGGGQSGITRVRPEEGVKRYLAWHRRARS